MIVTVQTRRRCLLISIGFFMASVFLLVLYAHYGENRFYTLSLPSELFWLEKYKSCLEAAMDSLTPEKLWPELENHLKKCELFFPSKKYTVMRLPNGREYKHALLPVQSFTDKERCVVIELGIGRKIGSEKELRKLYPKKCEFFGVDPNAIPNKLLFESIGGTYFKGAIGATDGTRQAILKTDSGYKPFMVHHTAFETYLKDHVGVNETIDWLSVDIEGGEVELFPAFLSNGLLDRLDMHVCQLNMEFHLIDGTERDLKKEIFSFLRRIVLEERFVILKPAHPWDQRITFYAINVLSPRCKRRYLGI